MKGLIVVAALALGGCAENTTQPETHSAVLTTPANPDNPPPTLSGYAETSYTKQFR